MDDTDMKIMEAALKIFAREGYEGATTRKIAREAGINAVTLFRRFGSKENILNAIIAYNQANFLERWNTLFAGDGNTDIEQDLQAIGEQMMKMLSERIDILTVLISEARRRPGKVDALSAFPALILQQLEKYFQCQVRKGTIRGVDPRTAALMFISYVYYITLMKHSIWPGIVEDEHESLKAFVRTFAQGIKVAD